VPKKKLAAKFVTIVLGVLIALGPVDDLARRGTRGMHFFYSLADGTSRAEV